MGPSLSPHSGVFLSKAMHRTRSIWRSGAPDLARDPRGTDKTQEGRDRMGCNRRGSAARQLRLYRFGGQAAGQDGVSIAQGQDRFRIGMGQGTEGWQRTKIFEERMEGLGRGGGVQD